MKLQAHRTLFTAFLTQTWRNEAWQEYLFAKKMMMAQRQETLEVEESLHCCIHQCGEA